LTEKKQKVKAAHSALLRSSVSLKKKNSLRSNSFFFLTLHYITPLYATNMRPVIFRSLCIVVGAWGRIAVASLDFGVLSRGFIRVAFVFFMNNCI
jgi:hypothetical protein